MFYYCVLFLMVSTLSIKCRAEAQKNMDIVNEIEEGKGNHEDDLEVAEVLLFRPFFVYRTQPQRRVYR